MSQHDYIISDQTGAAFLADLNLALGAIATQNKGSARPSPILAGQAWIDDTTAAPFWLLKIWDGVSDSVMAVIDPAAHRVIAPNSLYSGASRPAYLQPNQTWLKTSLTPNELYFWNGTADTLIDRVDTVNSLAGTTTRASRVSGNSTPTTAPSNVSTVVRWSSPSAVNINGGAFLNPANDTDFLIPATSKYFRLRAQVGWGLSFANACTLSIVTNTGAVLATCRGLGSADLSTDTGWIASVGVSFLQVKVLQTSSTSKDISDTFSHVIAESRVS